MIHWLMRLCRHGFYDSAFHLVHDLFPTHFTEIDPTEYDMIKQNLNMSSYFFKSLAEYSNTSELLINYATDSRIQTPADRHRHIHTVLNHSLLVHDRPVQFNLKLMERFKQLGCLTAFKINYFMPLILEQIRRLDPVMKELANSTNDELTSHGEFIRLQSLIRIIKYEFDCQINVESMNQILSWLRFDQNDTPKPYVKFTHLVDLFTLNGFNKLELFNCCAYKILNYRKIYILRNQLRFDDNDRDFISEFNFELRADFADLAGLLEKLDVKMIEEPMQLKIADIVNFLISRNQTIKSLFRIDGEENDPILRTILLINKYASSKFLDNLNNRIKIYLVEKHRG